VPLTITSSTGTHRFTVEVAETPEQQAQGLMNRQSLAPDRGMVFPRNPPGDASFWMKNTLIPLDIAFYDRRGRILKLFTMTPCRRDPCRTYDPGVSYRAALEVNAGSFRRWNVRAGDRIAVRVTRAG
jgi:uncharacterized membrane protein (UPF0127 family)